MSDPRTGARVGVAQIDGDLGDLPGNLNRALAAIDEARTDGVELLVFPELHLTGVALGDRVPEVARRPDAPEIDRLRRTTIDGPSLMIGFVEDGGAGNYFNVTAYLEQGRIVSIQRKLYLPGYGIFDEARTFIRGDRFRAFDTRFGRAAMLICEDAWHTALPYLAAMDGATLLLTTSASPKGGTSATLTSADLWLSVNRTAAVTLKCHNVYANRIGHEGELEYWGGSHVLAPDGALLAQGPLDDAALVTADLDLTRIDRERYGYRYVQDERLELTLRELRRIAGDRWGVAA